MCIWLDKTDLIRVFGFCCSGEWVLRPLVLKYKRTSQIGYPSYQSFNINNWNFFTIKKKEYKHIFLHLLCKM